MDPNHINQDDTMATMHSNGSYGAFAYPQPYSPAGSPGGPTSPGGSGPGSPPGDGRKKHVRNYQACKPCRQRKVKCDMGSTENPHNGPCARCARERRACVFDEKRKKDKPKRRESPDTQELNNGESSRPGAKRAHTSMSNFGNGFYSPANGISPNGMQSMLSPMQYQSPEQQEAVRVMQSDAKFKQETFDGQQALTRLVEAAELLNQPSMETAQAMAGGLTGQAYDNNAPNTPFTQNAKKDAARKHWSRFKYVRSGLMTAEEAMAYVDYFYTNCMPFTPISVPDYRNPDLHQTLLEREPFLLMAIMTIATRFMELNNGSRTGQISRPQNIHSVMFKDTQKLLSAIVYAQEQFGGGFSGAGKAKAKSSDPLHRFGLRSITTVEALLLLCEWAPRALHFPPEDDIELVTPFVTADQPDNDNDNVRVINADGDKRRDSWLEPAWRCDTMIWMLLHNAKALALEIGLFEYRTEEALRQAHADIPVDEIHDYWVRKLKTREVFWSFYVQTCGRLELIGKMPPGYLESLNNGTSDVRVRQVVEIRKANFIHGTNQPFAHLPDVGDTAGSSKEAHWFFWQEITAIMKSANQNMFPNKEQTRGITQNGDYRMWIHVYTPLLDEWRAAFDQCDKVQEPMRTILYIEYEYVRLYIHSLPLQAFVNRAVANTPSKRNLDTFGGEGSNPGGGFSLQEVRKWMAEDMPYVRILVESCQHILALIGESKIPKAKIKHLTVRVYFRIMASAVHLLKSFVVGAYADNIKRSFELLQKATVVLRHEIVDDVHIGTVFAEMIDVVSAQLEKRLTRFLPPSGVARSRAHSATPQLVHSPAVGAASSGRQVLPTPTNFNQVGVGLQAMPGSSNTPTEFNYVFDHVEPWDASQQIIAMPPPNYQLPGDQVQLDMSSYLDNATFDGGQEWFAASMNPIVNTAMANPSNEVNDSHYGPMINGTDMLDPYMYGQGFPIDNNGLTMHANGNGFNV